MYGAKKMQVALVHRFVRPPGDAKFKWGLFNAMPALKALDCREEGVETALDRGLTCDRCSKMRKLQGNSNPGQTFISEWGKKISRCFERRDRDTLTASDVADAKTFIKKNQATINRFTDEGRVLFVEAQAQVSYASNILYLAKKLPKTTFKLSGEDSVPSVPQFFKKAAELYASQPKFKDSIVCCMMEGLVTQWSTGQNNIRLEGKVKNFYRYLDTVSPAASSIVAANLGRAPSKRWM